MSNNAIYKPKGSAQEYAQWACNFYVGCCLQIIILLIFHISNKKNNFIKFQSSHRSIIIIVVSSPPFGVCLSSTRSSLTSSRSTSTVEPNISDDN